MKTFNPFASQTKFENHPNLYTFGIEVEFYSTPKYFNSIQQDSYYTVLGTDGAGQPTGEYRSPVFKSNSPRIASSGCIKFTNQVLTYVMDKFPVTFNPMKKKTRGLHLMENPRWCENCGLYHCGNGDFSGELIEKNGEKYIQSARKYPLGIHFSLGGKFFSEASYFLDIYGRAEEVQKNLINVVEDKDLYLMREKRYSGSFDRDNHARPKDYNVRTYSGIKSTPTELKLLEFRFLPSCKFNSVIPYLNYIILGGNIPSNTITNFDSCGEDD